MVDPHLPMYALSASSTRHRSPSVSPSSPLPTDDFRSRSPSRDHSRPRWSRSSRTAYRLKSLLRPRLSLLLTVAAVSLAVVFLGMAIYEPYIEIQFHSRAWIRQHITPEAEAAWWAGNAASPSWHDLSNRQSLKCFTSALSPAYNVTENWYGKKSWQVQSGVGLKLGRDCYEFAATVGRGGLGLDPVQGSDVSWERKVYHTYWRTDLSPFTERQAQMLRSFFATQPLSRSKLILWSNGDLMPNPILLDFVMRYPDSFELRRVEIPELVKGTALEGSKHVENALNDKKAWVDGDLVRLLVLWKDGGIWVDMDMLLTRSLDPLWEYEFVTQWDCYDKPLQPFNGALLSFHKHSPYLCLLFEIMTLSPAPRPASTDWGALLYLKAYRTLLHLSIPPFRVLPWCFVDGCSCRLDNRLPDPFTPDIGSSRPSAPRDWLPGPDAEIGAYGSADSRKTGRTDPAKRWSTEQGGDLDRVLGMVFAVHLHNRWEKQFPPAGWVERLLVQKYDELLGELDSIGGRRSVGPGKLPGLA